jgi:hypothetical protein
MPHGHKDSMTVQSVLPRKVFSLADYVPLVIGTPRERYLIARYAAPRWPMRYTVLLGSSARNATWRRGFPANVGAGSV